MHSVKRESNNIKARGMHIKVARIEKREINNIKVRSCYHIKIAQYT